MVKCCVGCGYCCLEAACPLSYHFYYKEVNGGKICPGLYFKDYRYWCRLAMLFPVGLSIGAGCCSPLNSWRQDIRERR